MKTLIAAFFLAAASAGAESLWVTDDLSPANGHFVWAPAKLFMSFNPRFPIEGSDGPLWQGKGLNTSLSGGGAVAWQGFTIEFRPEIDFSQNLSYTMLNGPGDYWWGLDRVQSYGKGGIAHLDWGQSEVRWVWEHLRVDFGTKALVFGPGQRNHVLMSDNAGGYPHLSIGTDSPVETPWGFFEGRMLWGAISDSTLYDQISWGGVSDWRFFHGLTVGYSPPFWPELTLGGARIFYSPWATITAFKAFESVADTVWKDNRGSLSGGAGQEDDVDQLIAAYFDYHLPDFRIYGELARNDHATDLRDFLIQPDHTFGYVVGFQKTFSFTGFQWDVRYEQADLGLNYGTVVRGTGSWYRHGPNPAGYTLGGQLLGAEIGPGSNGNYFELGYRRDGRRYFFSWERIANDVDYWVNVVQPTTNPNSGAYITFISTLGIQFPWQSINWTVTGGYIYEFDRYWIAKNDDWTWRFSVGLDWKP